MDGSSDSGSLSKGPIASDVGNLLDFDQENPEWTMMLSLGGNTGEYTQVYNGEESPMFHLSFYKI